VQSQLAQFKKVLSKKKKCVLVAVEDVTAIPIRSQSLETYN
jgi:hypothetical protein